MEPPDVGVEGLFAGRSDRSGEGRNLDWVCRRAALLGCRGLHASAALVRECGCAGAPRPRSTGVDQMLLLLRWADRLPSQVVLEITDA